MTLQRYVPSSRTLWLISQEKVGDHESPPFLISNRPHPSCKVGCRTVDLAQCEGRALAAQHPDHQVSPIPVSHPDRSAGVKCACLGRSQPRPSARRDLGSVGRYSPGEDEREAGCIHLAFTDASTIMMAPGCWASRGMGSSEVVLRIWNNALWWSGGNRRRSSCGGPIRWRE